MEGWITPLASILVAIVMAIPGVIALVLQRRKEDATADKIKSDTKKTDADIADVVQDVYRGIIDDLTKQSTESKNEITKMSQRITEIVSQNEKLIQQNRELRLHNELLIDKVDKLTIGVRLLISQLKKEGLTPEYNIEEI